MGSTNQRRELTSSEKAAAKRVKALYEEKKAWARQRGVQFKHDDVAEALGWSGPGAVSHYLNARIPLNLEACAKFARYFGVGMSDISPELAALLPNDTVEHYGTEVAQEVPLIPWSKVADVCGRESTPEGLATHAEDWILCPKPHSPQTFALTVSSQSNYNPADRYSINEGDILHIDPQVKAKSGRMVAVKWPPEDGSDVRLRQLIEEGPDLYLKALNPAWPDAITEMPGGAEILGCVIAKTVYYD